MSEDALCRLLDIAKFRFPKEEGDWFDKISQLTEDQLISLARDEFKKISQSNKERILIALEGVPTQNATNICIQYLSLSYKDLSARIGNDTGMSRKILHVMDALIEEVRTNAS